MKEDHIIRDEKDNLIRIDFTIPGKPMGKQRPRIVSRGKFSKAYTPKETVNYENLVKMCYTNTSDGLMFADDVGLEMWINAYMEVPKSMTRKDRDRVLSGQLHYIKKPDIDNIAKIICDSLNKIAYRDDKQICRLNVFKNYTFNQPKVKVIIQTV